MEWINYQLPEEGWVNRFLTAEADAQHEALEPAAWRERARGRVPAYPAGIRWIPGEIWKWDGMEGRVCLYVPFGNPGYDRSGYYPIPSVLRTCCFTALWAPEEELAEFELESCGGVTVWNGEKLAARLSPFTRNRPERKRVSIRLRRGENPVTICLEELAEGNTDCFFHLRYLGRQRLELWLPLDQKTEPGEVRRWERILEHVNFSREAYVSEPVVLELPGALVRRDRLELSLEHSDWRPGMGTDQVRLKREYALRAGQRTVELLKAEEMLPGFYTAWISVGNKHTRLRRQLGCQMTRRQLMEGKPPSSIRERRLRLLEHVIAWTPNHIYKAAALGARDYGWELAEQIISSQLQEVRKGGDGSDASFAMILFLCIRYCDRMSLSLKNQVEEAAVRYRYGWEEPEGDETGFLGENHALLFPVCQYLAGRLFPGRLFAASQRMGAEVCVRGRAGISQWLDRFFENYITEWNSSACLSAQVHGLAILYNVTWEEEPLHGRAKQALDQISRNLAICGHRGTVAASLGSACERELMGSLYSESTALLYLLYAEGYPTGSGAGSVALAMGDYEAPGEYRKYLTPERGSSLVFLNTQGVQRHVNLYLYKNSQVLLSAAVGFKPFQRGYQEHIMEASVDGVAQVFVNHPGKTQPYGWGCRGFWAGNGVLPMGVQYGNLGILVYDIPEEEPIDYTHAYVPLAEFRSYNGEGNALVLEKAGGSIGIKAMNGLVLQKNGPAKDREFISPGRRNVWVIKVTGEDPGMTQEAFLEQMGEIVIEMGEDRNVCVQDGGLRFRIGTDGSFTVNGNNVCSWPLSAEGVLTLEKQRGRQRGSA